MEVPLYIQTTYGYTVDSAESGHIRPRHFDPIKRNLGFGSIIRSELILFLWFCSRTSDSINQ